VIDASALRRRAPAIDRSSDRVVVVVAVAGSVAFLVLALAALLLPSADRRGAWLSIHLALAGGATTAIAGVMPFFAAAFAAAPPSDARLRFAAVGAVALGAIGASVGVVGAAPVLAGIGGATFLAGVIATGVATIRPLGRALGPSRGLVTQGYVVALGFVAAGALIATLFAAGWTPLVDRWAALKPAHAWLNLVGFVSLVVATTLLHFFPTVVGARIIVRPSARLTVAGLAVGAPLVALGFALESDALVRIAAIASAAGAGAIAANAATTWPTRARWTTDPAWHRFAIGSLVSAITWFEVGMAIAVGRILAFGASPAAWSVEVVTGPLIAGWMGLAVLGSATHLLPAVGPGDPAAHRRQRALLGRLATARLIVANGGVAGLAIGLPLHLAAVAASGAVLLALGLGSTAVLMAGAIRLGLERGGRAAGPGSGPTHDRN
jgi:nitrite reductase (NO-forming)